MSVLVVEDDKALGMFLQKGLALAGHQVDLVGDGEAALASASERRPDLMVLDLGLPRLDGTEVLVQVQILYRDVSVLVLSGRNDVEERIRCLNSGVDDYVMKPFSFHELMARCTGILRRRERHCSAVLHHGELEINRVNHSVRRGGWEIELTAKEYALLEFMMLRRGECCTRTELLRELWQMSPEAATNIVDVYINYLRRKLAAACPDGEFTSAVIETVRGAGYRLARAPMPIPAAILRQNDAARA
ncbi:MAG: response regulator transcription factor [Acidobacteriaceae bacterium]